MNQNETRTLWISLGSALFAVLLLYSYTQEKSQQLTEKYGAKKRVVVAAKDIQELETIDETMLDIVERPVDYVPPNAFSNPEEAVGQIALVPVSQGEVVLDNKVIVPGPVTGLGLQVSPTKRAVTIPIDETRGVAKLLVPGDRIDLVAALDVGTGANQRKEVKTIMQDVPILATGRRVANELPGIIEKQGKDDYIVPLRGDLSFESITIEASPKEAQGLIYILATAPASLFVTLRHPSDHDIQKLSNTTVETVLDKVSPSLLQKQTRSRRPAAAPKPKPRKNTQKKKGPFMDL